MFRCLTEAKFKECSFCVLTRWYPATCAEWISCKSDSAAAHRAVPMHATLCVLAALSATWIHTLLSDARQVIGTVGVQNTFWSTGGRNTLVACQTGAGSAAVLFTALGVRAARARLARVLRPRRFS